MVEIALFIIGATVVFFAACIVWQILVATWKYILATVAVVVVGCFILIAAGPRVNRRISPTTPAVSKKVVQGHPTFAEESKNER